MPNTLKIFTHDKGSIVVDDIQFSVSINAELPDDTKGADVLDKICNVIELELRVIERLRQRGHNAFWHNNVIHVTGAAPAQHDEPPASSASEPGDAKPKGLFQPSEDKGGSVIAEYVKVVDLHGNPALFFCDKKGDGIKGVPLFMRNNKPNAKNFKAFWDTQGGKFDINDPDLVQVVNPLNYPVAISYKENQKDGRTYIDIMSIKKAE